MSEVNILCTLNLNVEFYLATTFVCLNSITDKYNLFWQALPQWFKLFDSFKFPWNRIYIHKLWTAKNKVSSFNWRHGQLAKYQLKINRVRNCFDFVVWMFCLCCVVLLFYFHFDLWIEIAKNNSSVWLQPLSCWLSRKRRLYEHTVVWQ